MALSHRMLRLALIATAALMLYLPGLGRPALWEPDEGRYAEIAREMYLSGDYVTPRNDYVRYFEKPPLMYWAEAGCFGLFGVSEFSARLPAALFSAGTVVVTAALAEAMLGAEIGLLAATALGLAPLFFGFARFATLDPALSFFITAAMACFYAAARTGDFASRAGRRWFIASAAMLAMGTLAKGPVALALGGAIAFVWLALDHRAREAARMPWIWAVIVYCALTVPWFVLVATRNPGFLRFFFVHEHVERYLESTEHGWGPWFFVPVTIAGTWPWFFFAPTGVRALSRDGAKRSELRFLLTWFILIFVFFSIPRAKLGSYILPALPALAILSGYGMSRLWSDPAKIVGRRLGWFLALNLAAALGGAIALALSAKRLEPALVTDGLEIAALFAAAATLCFALGRFGRRPGRIVAALALAMVLVMGVGARAREDAAPLATYRNLARAATSYLKPGCVLASYRHDVQSLPFYTGFREALVSYRGELAPFSTSEGARASFIASDKALAKLWGSGACVVLVANRRDLGTLAAILTPKWTVVGCEGKKLALYNRPAAHPPSGCGSQGR
jgi:4-amino-4-deoxy-L-arabinose transferase-like glycosyltransferase